MIRKKIVLGIGMGVLIVMPSLSSCSGNENGEIVSEEFGTVKLGVSAGKSFDLGVSRAVDEAPYAEVNNYKVRILKGEKVQQEFDSVKDLPDSIQLTNGTYTVQAFYGTEHAMSREEFFSQATQEVKVQANKQLVNLSCEPTCAKVKVNFDADMVTYFKDYEVTFATKALGEESALWKKDDVDPWYLLVDRAGEEVKATIKLTPKEEYETTSAKVVKKYTLKPNNAWTLNVAPKYTAVNGQLGITITIDTKTNDIPVDIVVPSDWITGTN